MLHQSAAHVVGTITIRHRIDMTTSSWDDNRAVGRLLADRGIAHRRQGNALLADAEEAGGVVLAFQPGCVTPVRFSAHPRTAGLRMSRSR